MRKPITHTIQKASPLKGTEITMESGDKPAEGAKSKGQKLDETAGAGEQKQALAKASSKGKKATDAEAYIAMLQKQYAGRTGQELFDAGYISEAYIDRFPSATEASAPEPKTAAEASVEGATKPGKEGTKFTPTAYQEFTGIRSWEQRQNERTFDRARNQRKDVAKRQLKDFAREMTRGMEGGYFEKMKARRNFMQGDWYRRGDGTPEERATYERAYGLDKESQSVKISTAAQEAQVEGLVGKGEKGRFERNMTAADMGTQEGENILAHARKNLGDDELEYKAAQGGAPRSSGTTGDNVLTGISVRDFNKTRKSLGLGEEEISLPKKKGVNFTAPTAAPPSLVKPAYQAFDPSKHEGLTTEQQAHAEATAATEAKLAEEKRKAPLGSEGPLKMRMSQGNKNVLKKGYFKNK